MGEEGDQFQRWRQIMLLSAIPMVLVAGPLVGLWDRQQGVPGRGDVPILPNTWFSIELSAQTEVPEWSGQPLWVGQEEDAFIDVDGKINWVLARQTQYHLVK